MSAGADMTATSATTLRRFNLAGAVLTLLTVFAALVWAFPIYWGVISSFKPEDEVVRPVIELWPENFTFRHYAFALFETQIGRWYLNSIATALGTMVVTVVTSLLCGYAISQLRFPGRKALWWLILGSFMIPTQTLIITHFVLVAKLSLLNTWAGIIIVQAINPVVAIVYKQFFDQVPKDFREAALMDNASEWRILTRVYIPMNWGVTTALAIVSFIWAWNSFLWPFLAVTKTEAMTITVGITQVSDAFGISYARNLAAAVLAGLPVALAYLLFQRRVTRAITLSAGIKG